MSQISGTYAYVIKALLKLLLVLGIYFVCRVLFFLLNQQLFDTTFREFLSYCFWGIRFDITAMMYLNAGFLVLSLLPVTFRSKRGYIKTSNYFFIIPNIIGILANCIDFGYFPFILHRMNFSNLAFFTSEKNAFGIIGNLALDFWYVPVLFAVISALFLWANGKIEKKIHLPEKVHPGKRYYLTHGVILILSAALIFLGIRGRISGRVKPLSIINAGKYVDQPMEAAIVLNTPFSIMLSIQLQDLEEANYMSNEEADQLVTFAHGSGDKKEFASKNVVILILESFGKEYIGFFNQHLDSGNYKGYTPFLDSLLEKSYVFTNAWANGRKSIEAMPAIIAGIPSLDVQYSSSIFSGNTIHSIPNRLKGKGYYSAFFHGAENGSMFFESFSKIAGFDDFYGKSEYLDAGLEFEGTFWGVHDEPFLQFFADEQSRMAEPFVNAIFTLSSHTPFELPEKHKGKFPEGKLPIHKMVRYSDYALKQYFERVKKEPWFRNTIFIITPDHCSLPVHAEYKTGIGQYAIPLAIYEPESSFVGKDSALTQQIDIMPLVLDRLGFDEPYFCFGKNPLDTATSPEFAINHAYGIYQLLMGDYLLRFDGKGVTGFFNCKKDILLQQDLSGKSFPEQQEMLTFLKAYIQKYNYAIIHNQMTTSDNKADLRQ